MPQIKYAFYLSHTVTFNVKRHLKRSNLHLNDHGIFALEVFKRFLNNFNTVWLQNKHNLFTAGHGSVFCL